MFGKKTYAMTLEEAFAYVGHLPQRDRILLGFYGDGTDLHWSAFDGEAMGLLEDFAESHGISDTVMRIAEEFREGYGVSAVSAVAILQLKDSSNAVLVLGLNGPSSLAEMVRGTMKDMATRYAH